MAGALLKRYKMNKTLVIVLVVVVIVAVAASAIILTGDDDDDEKKSVNAATGEIDYETINLMIYGNANNDLTIDAQDKTLIQQIIDGTVSAEGHPFADVNLDGVIDDKDLEEVQKIIDRENGITLHVACYNYKNEKDVVDVTYPLENIGLYGMHTITATLYANAGDKVAAYANPSGGKDSWPVFMATLGGESISAGMGASASIDWQGFMQIDAKTPIGAMIVDTAYSSNLSAITINDFKNAGIPILAFNGNSAYADAAASAWIGFLCGSSSESYGRQFAETSQTVLDAVHSKVGNLSDSQKKSFIEMTMWICIYQNDAPANSLGELAGGIHYSKINSEYAKAYAGTGFAMNQNAETLANYQDVGAYLSIRTNDFGGNVNEIVIEQYEFKTESFGNIMVVDFMHNAKERLYFVNNLLPTALKVAYIAQILYPDLFDENFADNYAQQYINGGYAPFKGQTVDSLITVMSYQDYKAAGGQY